MNFKKKVNDSWTDTPNYIHGTSSDTFTTLPAVIHPTSTAATVGLKGQTTQSSTPSLTSPVMPQGCGDLETVGAKAGQYKIPIINNGVTTPLYLESTVSNRRIKKLVLDGTEDLTLSTLDANRTVCQLTNLGCANALCLCTHIEGKLSYSSNEYNRILTYTSFNGVLYISIEKGLVGSTLETFKAYLAAQYAAGTPVTVWYVLATEETGIVNEPLMKIGDYADTVSGISIPTIAGGDTISVDTTLQPSEVTVNYKGWHPVTDVHEHTNGAWT